MNLFKRIGSFFCVKMEEWKEIYLQPIIYMKWDWIWIKSQRLWNARSLRLRNGFLHTNAFRIKSTHFCSNDL